MWYFLLKSSLYRRSGTVYLDSSLLENEMIGSECRKLAAV